MANWIKLRRPSWWKFQARRAYSVPAFWWKCLRIRPFPDDVTSINQVADFGKRHSVIGFNRECIRAYIFWRLHQRFSCTSFVETGTFLGYTSAFVRRAFKTPVFTSEINATRYLVSRAYLAWALGTTISHSSSTDFLARVCDESTIGNNPMFYLDAHWEEYMPLPDELATVAKQCEKALILIDDFYVPWEPRFLYDEYPDVRIDLETLDRSLGALRKDISVYLPAYSPDQDPTGKGIGFAVVLMGQDQELPEDLFPFDLIRKAVG